MKTKTKKSKSPSKSKKLKTKSNSKTKSSNNKLEDKKWLDFAILKQITSPFFQVVGHPVRRTSDGKSYQTPEEFFADGGNTNLIQVTNLD